MKNFKFPIVFSMIAALLFFAGCASKMPDIGTGKPDKELEQCLRLFAKHKYDDSVQCLEIFKSRYPDSRLSEEAELLIGDSYFAKKEYLLAAESYAVFLRLHPLHAKAAYAHYRIGISYFREAPKAYDRDQSYVFEAIDHLRTAIRRYPRSEYTGLSKAALREARLRIAELNFYIGRFYYRTGQYISCIPRFWTVAEEFPDSGIGDKALYMIVRASIKLDRIESAKDAFTQLASRYPSSKFVKEAEKKVLKATRKEMS